MTHAVGDTVIVVDQHESQKFAIGKPARVIEVEQALSFPYRVEQIKFIEWIESDGIANIPEYGESRRTGWVAPHHIVAAPKEVKLPGEKLSAAPPFPTAEPTAEKSPVADHPTGDVALDGVLRPSYYRLPNGLEAHEVSGWFSANVGIAMNYLMRHGQKPGCPAVRDLQKAIEHLQFEVKRLKGSGCRATQGEGVSP